MSDPDFVFITNPLPSANNLPVIGVLSPGENKVPRAAYLKAIDHVEKKMVNGKELEVQVAGAVPWGQLPGFTVRDPAKKQGPKDMPADEAVAFVLNVNKPEMLAELREAEKRKAVLAALDHQAKFLDLASQKPGSLRSMLLAEREIYKRPDAVNAISKAVERQE